MEKDSINNWILRFMKLESWVLTVSAEILLFIGVLALMDMFSPAIIGVTVYVLLTVKEKQGRLLLAFLTTVFVFYFCTGLFLMFGLDIVFDPIAQALSSETAKSFMTTVGGILFIGSWFVPKKKAGESPKPKALKVKAMIGLGITTSLLEVAMAIPYFAAISLMISSKVFFFEWLPVLVIYNVMMVAPGIVLLLLHMLFRRLMEKPLQKLRDLFQKSTSSTLSWVMFFVGLILLLNSGTLG